MELNAFDEDRTINQLKCTLRPFPTAYRDRLTMPKYVISGSNDEFFLPDNSHYYFDQMKGPIYMR